VWTPRESDVYPELIAMTGEGLVSFVLVDSKKTYSITDAGTAWLAANPAGATEAENDTDAGAAGAGKSSGWSGNVGDHLAAKREFMKAGALLGQAVGAVVTGGKKADFEEAAKHLDATAKSIFELLSKSN